MRTSQPIAPNNSVPPGQGMPRTGLGGSTGQRLPVSPRERKPALAALAVLLILGGALVSAYLVIQSGQRVSAIQIAAPVAAGQRIPAGALQEVQVGDTGIHFVPWSARAQVTQAYAAVPLVKGALLTDEMVSVGGATDGRVIVGLALKSGQYPAGLSEGQHVALYSVGGQNAGAVRPGLVLAEDAIVYHVAGAGSATAQSDQISASVAVPPDQVPQLIQAASAGDVGVALLPTGTRVAKDQGQAGGQQPPAPQLTKPAQRQSVTPTGVPTGTPTGLRSP